MDLKLTKEEKFNFSKEGRDVLAKIRHNREREKREEADEMFGFSFNTILQEGKEEREREERLRRKSQEDMDNFWLSLAKPVFNYNYSEILAYLNSEWEDQQANKVISFNLCN